ALVSLGRRYEIPRVQARATGMRAWLCVMRGDLAGGDAALKEARGLLPAGQEDRRALTFLDWVEALAALEKEDEARAAARAPARRPRPQVAARRRGPARPAPPPRPRRRATERARAGGGAPLRRGPHHRRGGEAPGHQPLHRQDPPAARLRAPGRRLSRRPG